MNGPAADDALVHERDGVTWLEWPAGDKRIATERESKLIEAFKRVAERLAVAEQERDAARRGLEMVDAELDGTRRRAVRAETERDALAEVVAAVRKAWAPWRTDLIDWLIELDVPTGAIHSSISVFDAALAAVDRSTPAPTPETETQR